MERAPPSDLTKNLNRASMGVLIIRSFVPSMGVGGIPVARTASISEVSNAQQRLLLEDRAETHEARPWRPGVNAVVWRTDRLRAQIPARQNWLYQAMPKRSR